MIVTLSISSICKEKKSSVVLDLVFQVSDSVTAASLHYSYPYMADNSLFQFLVSTEFAYEFKCNTSTAFLCNRCVDFEFLNLFNFKNSFFSQKK